MAVKQTATKPSATGVSQRAPSQARSRARVDSILNAAKALIREQGSAQLKIQDIAERAGITAGSMYQYFPNKAAILEALAQQNIEMVRQHLLGSLPPIESQADCIDAFRLIVDRYFSLYRSEPALRDIWVSMAADKNLKAMDLEDSRYNAELVFKAIGSHFAKKHHPKLKRFLYLLMHWTGATVQLALAEEASTQRSAAAGRKEANKLIHLFKEVISIELIEGIFQDE